MEYNLGNVSRDMRRSFFDKALTFWAFAALLQLSIVGVLLYAAVHFIIKYW